jgi:hypothetical protein
MGQRSTIDGRRASSMAGGRQSTMHRQSNIQSRLSSRVSVDPSGAARASYAPRTSSLRPSLPANVARDHGGAQWGTYADGKNILQDAHAAATTPKAVAADSAPFRSGTEPLISKLG